MKIGTIIIVEDMIIWNKTLIILTLNPENLNDKNPTFSFRVVGSKKKHLEYKVDNHNFDRIHHIYS